MKSKKIIDWVLLLTFVLTASSGIYLHIIGHKNEALDHNLFIWSWAHSILAFLFMVFIIIHIKQHLSWYNALLKRTKNKKAKVIRISVLTLDGMFLLLLVTGLWLLFFPLGNFVKLGIAHYAIGLVSIVFALGHLLKRIKRLK